MAKHLHAPELTDEVIEAAFCGTNFGRTDYRDFLAHSVLKKACDWHCGYTITCIMVNLKLITPKTHKVTKLGKLFLTDSYPDPLRESRDAPPAPVVVKRPGTKCIGWVRDAIHEHDAKWIAAVEAAGGSVADKQYMVDLLELALAALTAEPVKVPDEPTGGDAPCHLDEYEGYCWVAGARWMRGKILSRLNAIDNTAQQYEALAGWKMVPIEPTAEMYDAGDKQLATKQVWDAMLAAAPKPEGQ
ncbi:hypothetical protein [Mixta calida]|uniref:hypothetical protein n=1 Tax=Mixta calida TaxID=665913 RepID=UPI00290DC7C7|nr:hypothetical protein [Mixta calida]MDU4288381.1 hypothetical protein [Mixta calida]